MVDVDDKVADLQIAQVGEERRAPDCGARSAARRSSSKTSRLGIDLQRRRRRGGIRATARRRRRAPRPRVRPRRARPARRRCRILQDLEARSARPGLSATNSTVSPRSRAWRMSAIQSCTRPWNSIAGWQRTWRAPRLPPHRRPPAPRGVERRPAAAPRSPQSTKASGGGERRDVHRVPRRRRSSRRAARAPRRAARRTCSCSDTISRTACVDARNCRSDTRRRRRVILTRRRRRRTARDGNDHHLIGRAGRALCCRVEAAQRLDHVADELDADRFGIGRRKHVDDAAADGERAVLVDRILAREAGIDQQVGQGVRLDLGAGPNLDRRRASSRSGGLTRGSSAGRGGDDETARSGAAAWSARARAAATRKCGVMPRYGSTCSDGNGSTARSVAGSDAPSSAA